MRCQWFMPLCCFATLAGCSDQVSKLSKEEAELLDAVMFVLDGREDNTDDQRGEGPCTRQVIGRSVEFSHIGKNGIGTSDDETNAKIRNSTFVRHVERISAPDTCVFRRWGVREFSKGDNKEVFTAYSMEAGEETFYLMNAYRFEMTFERGMGVCHHGRSKGCLLILGLWELLGPGFLGGIQF